MRYTLLRNAAALLRYGEHAFLDRFAAARDDGFDAVEFLFPYEHAPAVLAGLLHAHGLQQVLFNASPGDWTALAAWLPSSTPSADCGRAIARCSCSAPGAAWTTHPPR